GPAFLLRAQDQDPFCGSQGTGRISRRTAAIRPEVRGDRDDRPGLEAVRRTRAGRFASVGSALAGQARARATAAADAAGSLPGEIFHRTGREGMERMDLLNHTLALVGVVIIVAALLSGMIDRTGLPQVILFLLLGVALGPSGLNLVSFTLESNALRVVAILGL